jgi:hypothetical protein
MLPLRSCEYVRAGIIAFADNTPVAYLQLPAGDNRHAVQAALDELKHLKPNTTARTSTLNK